MLHDVHVTSAPRSSSVSISTAVWMVTVLPTRYCADIRQCGPQQAASTLRTLPACASVSDGCYQSRHLVLGNLEFLAAKVSQRHVSHFVLRQSRWYLECSHFEGGLTLQMLSIPDRGLRGETSSKQEHPK